MTRSTVVLSLITLLALGGCNTPSDISPSSSTSEPVTQQTDQSTDQTTASDNPEKPTASAPPATVSQPITSSSTDTPDTATSKEPAATTEANNNQAPQAGVTVLSANAEVKDTTIVPGQKVGMVTAGTTYAQLESEFGPDRLTSEDIHLGEGMMAPSTKVTLDGGYSFNVVWADSTKATPLEVRDLAPGWDIKGVRNGMSFEELQATLGEFELLGLGWDYGGTLLLENTPLADYSGRLFIRVQPSEKAVETQQEKFIAVAGDRAFSSTDPNFAELEMSVVEVVVRLE